jgi:hypothetical protein
MSLLEFVGLMLGHSTDESELLLFSSSRSDHESELINGEIKHGLSASSHRLVAIFIEDAELRRIKQVGFRRSI